ncbi:NAD(+)--arginine ADP-ribosyltransferase [Vibrio azureus]|uniref:ADP ribosyltransferase domain-containing protein n=1 Tax=Vibrio azureus NBRC 104587 TaxID=1219077 RepID=U3BY13_9VIBR|nr:ADP-ribosyltransferase [Vibrio azureus]AUI85910.1 NAD(+)--arginine ADP-ribosyltransferase [Vibrio azureus]GAD74214.1 hypothetical protein VAZ01S_005_00140 [Vibrio azureus NBRC 104587]
MSHQIYALIVLALFSVSVVANPLDALKEPLRSQQQIASHAERFSQWANQARGWRFKLLTESEREALEDFSISGYKVTNDYLRLSGSADWGSTASSAKEFVNKVKSGMRKLPRYKGIAYRGSWIKQSLMDKLRVGDVVVEPAFTSTTVIPEVAKRFAIVRPQTTAPIQRVWLAVDIKKQGKVLAGLSEFSREGEVLLPPNTYFRVTHIENFHKTSLIAVETVTADKAMHEDIYNLFTGEKVKPSFWQAYICG